jgi:hypothetical protein
LYLIQDKENKKMTEQTKDSFPTATEQLATDGVIDKVPGAYEGASYVPERIEVNADLAAIGLKRRDDGRRLLDIVSAEAVHAAQTANAQAIRQ